MINNATCNYSGCLKEPKKEILNSWYCKHHYKVVKNSAKGR
ncbi:hypothetical protein [Spiroplasma culicicola]|uniref:Uncharacterized protein n=1 Tax=Spiroplasma culicicola AES-1 TaxID=1276246 RepID=W6A7M9_9MOLU|nr:hypothetical protein [Spiroplasma culicicola]AHI52992.1 hypothetical protein SCULI_v1c06510 [Spiroplasma culicicola AES-1]